MLEQFRLKNRSQLTVWDVLIVTVILLGQFIVLSLSIMWESLSQQASEVAITTSQFDLSNYTEVMDNWYMIYHQGVLLMIAFTYLWIRGFDFKSLPFKWKWSVIGWTVFIFVLSGLAADLFSDLFLNFEYTRYILANGADISVGLASFVEAAKLDMVAYSLLNGFYEEIFFLGLFLSTKYKASWPVFIISTIIRISFHTYQGILDAVAIGLVFGGVYYYLYTRKCRNLLPFCLAHALADIMSASFFALIM